MREGTSLVALRRGLAPREANEEVCGLRGRKVSAGKNGIMRRRHAPAQLGCGGGAGCP